MCARPCTRVRERCAVSVCRRVPPPAETRRTPHRVPGSRAGGGFIYKRGRAAAGGPRPIQVCTRGARCPRGPPPPAPCPGGGARPRGGLHGSWGGGRCWGVWGFFWGGGEEGAAGMGEGTEASQVPPANHVPRGDGRVCPAPRGKEPTQSPKGFLGWGGRRSPPGAPAPVLSLGCPHVRGVSPRRGVSPQLPDAAVTSFARPHPRAGGEVALGDRRSVRGGHGACPQPRASSQVTLGDRSQPGGWAEPGEAQGGTGVPCGRPPRRPPPGLTPGARGR